jgi:hypothetical protein
MTDRELLEAAAKAAGLTIGAWSDNYGAFMYRGVEPGKSWWNALTDDGDAFRLMVRCLPFYTVCYSREDYEACNRDGLAASRRAIVRAAAEIGRSKDD